MKIENTDIYHDKLKFHFTERFQLKLPSASPIPKHKTSHVSPSASSVKVCKPNTVSKDMDDWQKHNLITI